MMNLYARSGWGLGALLAMGLAGCGGNTPVADSGATPDTVDVAVDDDPTTPDKPVAPDVPEFDAGPEDTGAAEDVRPDVPPPMDVRPDIVDVAMDRPTDVPADTGRDAGVDVPRDVPADVRPDVAVDTGPPISCTQCRTTLCAASNTACQSSVFCAERFTCLDRCPRASDPAECRSGCTRAWPATSQSSAFVSCLRMNCPSSCPGYQ